LNLAQNLFKQAGARVTTGELNRAVRQALDANPPPMRMNRKPKVYFATQVASFPPTIIIFSNGPELFDNTYQRYLLKSFRDLLPFHDVPILMYLRGKAKSDRDGVLPESLPPKKKATRRKQPTKAKKRGGAALWEDV
jgi:GTPase